MVHIVLVWQKQGGSSPVRSRLHVEEHAGLKADQRPRRIPGSPYIPPPYSPGQSARCHHQCVRSHTHGRPRDQRGLLQRLKVPSLESGQGG